MFTDIKEKKAIGYFAFYLSNHLLVFITFFGSSIMHIKYINFWSIICLSLLSCAEKPQDEPAINNCNISPQELVFSEVYTPREAESEYWIEVYNKSKRTIQLNRAFILINNLKIPLLDDLQIPAESYYVIGNTNSHHINNIIENIKYIKNPATLSLRCKDTVIDSVNYKKTKSYQSSYALDQAFIENSQAPTKNKKWCTQDNASPGGINQFCERTQCSVDQNLGSVEEARTTEITIHNAFTNPVGMDLNRQWLTLQIKTDVPLDLSELTIEQENLNAEVLGSWTIDAKTCLPKTDQFVHLLLSQISALNNNSLFKVANGPKLINQPSIITLYYKDIEFDRIMLNHNDEGKRQFRCQDADNDIIALCPNETVYQLIENKVIDLPDNAESQESVKFTCKAKSLHQKQWNNLFEKSVISEPKFDEFKGEYYHLRFNSMAPVVLSRHRLSKVLEYHNILDTDIKPTEITNTQCILVYPDEYLFLRLSESAE